MVNTTSGPLTVSHQTKDVETPGIMALKDALRESAKITAFPCAYTTAPVTAKAIAIPASVTVRFTGSSRVVVIALLESSRKTRTGQASISLSRFRDSLPSKHRLPTRHRSSGFIASELIQKINTY